MALRIQNVQTKKTERQIETEWAEVAAMKSRLLSSTDWTQLDDVVLENDAEIRQWRQRLRDIDIREDFNSPKTASRYLSEYEASFPRVLYSSDTSRHRQEDIRPEEFNENLDRLFQYVEALEKKITSLESLINEPVIEEEPVEYVSIENAQDIVLNQLKEQKNQNLVNSGSLEYPLISTKMEQAADFLSRDDEQPLAEYSLLKNNRNVSDVEYAEQILYECRNYFKNLYTIEKDYLHQIESVYNMSIDEMNEWFESHGYRYRCDN